MAALPSFLSEWETRQQQGQPEPGLAAAILKEAEKDLYQTKGAGHSREFWLTFLDVTRKSEFLLSLEEAAMRNRWSEIVFRVIQITNYSLLDMMVQRVEEHPSKTLFRDMSASSPVDWSYEQIFAHIREIASVFYHSEKEPRVALFTDNCVEGASCDLACLCYGIFDTPFSIHFSEEILVSIIDRLEINIVVTDTVPRLGLIKKVRQKTRHPFRIFTLQPHLAREKGIVYLPEECKKHHRAEIESILEPYTQLENNRVITTMFTSGSTGIPKGVSFTIYHIVSKRFARAAALPEAGDEVFLCYLPLFHTFGRYLDLTGSIFWSGTYVFAGNASAETLFVLFPEVSPTGFISVPLRWQELYEKCLEKIAPVENEELRIKAVRSVVGENLRWGLSAAGYLDPKVFRFFNEYGVSLCSGFGMTEATGGITMTPPGEYRDFKVGIPLPGVRTRLTTDSELQISGHYIARYLDEAGPGDVIPYPVSEETDPWLSTGDVFTVTEDGFYEIVDRVKDIYKNNRGQTVAPQIIEKKFFNVPGIKNTFLVGDNRPYNVLLIVPDRHDPIYKTIKDENLPEYFHQIVMAANSDVAPYERVINFTLLDRDFSADKGELTPKGSFNRKTIEANLSELIDSLYTSNYIALKIEGLTVQIPKWFFRDLGILESDILVRKNKLYNRRSKVSLTFRRMKDDFLRIGDLKYKISENKLDLGVFARQPRLWIGNPGLIHFSPVKEGWDLREGDLSKAVYLAGFRKILREEIPLPNNIRESFLIQVSRLINRALYSPPDKAYHSIEELGKIFGDADPRVANVIRCRLEALAFHPEEEIRALAYRTILLKAPRPEEIMHMPAFLESGKTYLNEKSIREIASSNMGKHRLDALKQRLYYYRNNLKWPASARTRKVFENVLRMLYDFAILHIEFYVPVRAELARWILHRQDPYLSKKAGDYFHKLSQAFENNMKGKVKKHPVSTWNSKLVFEYGIQKAERERITRIFRTTRFLEESVILTFNEWDFNLKDVPARGIWILRLQAMKEFRHYRLSINTNAGKHFDLHLVMSEDPSFHPRPDTFYWLASLAGFPFGPTVAPLLGCSRPDLGILSTQYIGGLSAWDKIREFAEIHRTAGFIKPNTWRKVFIRSLAVLFKAWHHSGYQLVPGAISPGNVVIPEMDFRESAVILSLTGWKEYRGPLSLIEPMVQNFYCRTAAVYPWCRMQFEIRWIFDACIEALGKEEAAKLLRELREEVRGKNIVCFDNTSLRENLEHYCRNELTKYHLPLSVYHAVDHYAEWHKLNPSTSAIAREQTIIELLELYRLFSYPELVRYFLYRHTYFQEASGEIRDAFDKLLDKMLSDTTLMPLQLIELSDLQSVIIEPEDKNVFSRMIFPRLHGEQHVDLMKVSESKRGQVVVKFNLKDKSGSDYIQREPIEPREIGQLYQLFYKENYPKEITNTDHHQVVVDKNEKIIGGLIWRTLDAETALLDGIVVTSALQGKGIASSMITNFFTSLAALGFKVVKAHFLFGNYYLKHYFQVDSKWGALIKTLDEE